MIPESSRAKRTTVYRWGLFWKSVRGLEHFMWWDGARRSHPSLFMTRKAAREHAQLKYGYIKTRKDLRRAPHHWRMPVALRVKVTVEIDA